MNSFCELLGVALVALHLGDRLELAVQEVLVATAEVHERVGDVAAEHGLLDGELGRAGLHRVEGGGDLGDLVAAGAVDLGELGHGDVLTERGVEDVLHGVGQAGAGHVLGVADQAGEGLGDRAAGQQGDADGEQQHRTGGDEHEAGLALGVGLLLLGLSGQRGRRRPAGGRRRPPRPRCRRGRPGSARRR